MSDWFETQWKDFTISTNPARLDIDAIADMLSRAYWASGRSRGQLERALRNSLVFGLYTGSQQVGLARVVTDYAVFAYLCDVIIHEEFRRRGLGKWQVGTVMAYPELQGLRRWLLATMDAHDLYRQYGWTRLSNPDRIMEILHPNPGEERA